MTILKNAPNFRDMGGIPLANGQFKPGLVYRSNHLCYLDDADQQAFKDHKIAHIIDFRSGDEHEKFPPKLADGHIVQQHSLAIQPGSPKAAAEAMAAGSMSADFMSSEMADIYKRLIDDQLPTYRRFFELLLNTDQPVVFNCVIGKDRTGIAAMLLLLSLGASWQAVEQDYLITGQRTDVAKELDRSMKLWGDKLPIGTKAEWFEPIFKTELAYLHRGRQALIDTYGDINGYWQALELGDDARQALIARLVV